MRVGVLRKIPETRDNVDIMLSGLEELKLDKLFLLDNRPPSLDGRDLFCYRAKVPRVGRSWLGKRLGMGRLARTSKLDPFIYGARSLKRLGAVSLRGAKGVDTSKLPLEEELAQYLESGPETYDINPCRPMTVIAATNGFPEDTEGLTKLLHKYHDSLLFFANGQHSKIVKVRYVVNTDDFGVSKLRVTYQNEITPFPISMDMLQAGGGTQHGYNIPYCDRRTHLIAVGIRDLAVLDGSGRCPHMKFFTFMKHRWF